MCSGSSPAPRRSSTSGGGPHVRANALSIEESMDKVFTYLKEQGLHG